MSILKDLHNIDVKDLKNIDIEEIKNNVRQKPHIFINSALIVLAVIVSINILVSSGSNLKKLKFKLASLEKKLAVVEKNNAIEAELDQYIEDLPDWISSDRFIAQISNMAINRNIKIKSVSPSVQRGDDLSEQTLINLKVSAKKYANLVLFMSDLEDIPHLIRTDSWHGNLAQQSRRDSRNPNITPDVEANIKISLLKLRNE